VDFEFRRGVDFGEVGDYEVAIEEGATIIRLAARSSAPRQR